MPRTVRCVFLISREFLQRKTIGLNYCCEYASGVQICDFFTRWRARQPSSKVLKSRHPTNPQPACEAQCGVAFRLGINRHRDSGSGQNVPAPAVTAPHPWIRGKFGRFRRRSLIQKSTQLRLHIICPSGSGSEQNVLAPYSSDMGYVLPAGGRPDTGCLSRVAKHRRCKRMLSKFQLCEQFLDKGILGCRWPVLRCP